MIVFVTEFCVSSLVCNLIYTCTMGSKGCDEAQEYVDSIIMSHILRILRVNTPSVVWCRCRSAGSIECALTTKKTRGSPCHGEQEEEQMSKVRRNLYYGYVPKFG